MTALLVTEHLSKQFGGVIATDDVGLTVNDGEIHAVIGPNGAGKTTLIAQLAGELAPDAGTIRFDGRDVTRLPVHERSRLGLARSFQVTSIFREFTVLDNVALAVQAHSGSSFRFWHDARRDPALRGPARAALAAVGLADRADVVAGNLAHGEQRQLEIAMTLATEPQVLLLDEPLAGMGVAEAERMVALLLALKKEHGMLLVEHDMDAVFTLADRLTVMVNGQVIASGSPAQIRADAGVQAAYLGEEHA